MENFLQTLNERFAIPGHVTFREGPGGLETAVIDNPRACGEMTLAGAHVMAYTIKDSTGRPSAPLLWASPTAAARLDGPMRGGAPLCWPWFAVHPTDPQGKQMHGFARTMLWEVAATAALPDGSTVVTMRLESSADTLALWPHAFTLEMRAVFGERLHLEWTARNPGPQPYTYSGAIHPYYVVSDSRAVTVSGLEGVDYLDKNEGFRRKTLAGELAFHGPVDCVFLATTGDLAIHDPGLLRVIRIRKRGSRTTVVWNPHDADATQADVGAGNHRGFVCAEAANAFGDEITVPPGGEARLGMEIWTEGLG